MKRRELFKEIEATFREAGKMNDWIYYEFKNLYRRNQLVRFQIFEISWFSGAQKILDLVDELHTVVTDKDEFIAIANLLHLDIRPQMSKKKIVEIVKDHPSWKVKAMELENLKLLDTRKKDWQPFYEKLKQFGYSTELLPKQIGIHKWIVDATNQEGIKETLYLNEDDRSNSIWIQSTYNNVVGIIQSETELFVGKM